MSNVGQAALDVVAVAVAVALAPSTGGASVQWALEAFAIANAAGQILFPTQLPNAFGPRLGDHQTTTASLGDPIVIGYGVFPTTGTVIFLDEVVEHATTKKVGGKGAPSQKQTTYTYTQSIAIGLCETTSMAGTNNPILGIQRIWENGELVYDTRPIQDGETTSEHGHDSSVGTYQQRLEANAKYAETFVLYLGTETQDPDPTIELQQGVGTTLSYRGLAYIVYPDRLLRSDQGTRHPTFKFEILAAGDTEATVIDPTYLPGGEHSLIQIDVIGVDWDNFRYYIWSGSPGLHTVLAFDLLTNTQIAENDSFWDKTASADANFVILSDGTLLVQWVEASHSYIIKMNPTTLAPIGVAASYPLTSALWQTWALTTLNFGSGPVDYLCAAGAFAKVTITDCSTLISTTTFTYTDHPRVCAGLTEGGNGVFWVISNTPRIFGPTGGDIAVHKILVESGTITSTLKHTFAPSEIDATWGYITTIGDMILDPSDGHIIMRVAHSLDGKFVKFNGETGAIDWATDIALGANYDYAFGRAGISNNAIWFTDAVTVGHYFSLNASTGELTSVDISDLLAGATDGAAATNSGLLGGAILTNINSDGVPGWSLILPANPVAGNVTIADIVADLCERSGLHDHDTSSLGDETVEGYTIATTPMNARDAIVPLRSVGFFDSVETGDLMKFVKRGGAPVVTLGVDDIGAIESDTSDDPPAANSVSIPMESELPQQLRVSYMSPSRNYQPGQQLSPVRFDTLSQNIVDVQLGGVCITDDVAAQVSEILWNDAWQADHTFTFAVDQSFAYLEPTDVVLLPMQGTLFRVRITSIDDASQVLRTMTAVTDDDGTYVSEAVAQQVPTTVTMKFHADSSLVLMDAPLLQDANDTGRVSAPMYSAVFPGGTDSWTGAEVFESSDGTTYEDAATASNAADAGLALTALGDTSDPFVTDTVNTIQVQMEAASTLPSTITDTQLLNGGNVAALIDADGSIEIFQFRDVTVDSADTVTLSYLLRGRRGSESMTGNHAVGGRFVMLATGTVQKENLHLSDLTRTLQWKAVGTSQSLDDVDPVPFASVGRSLMPRAPWNTRTSLAGSDILIMADRRSRIENESAISFVSDTMALNEDSEAYQIDIFDTDGTTLLRTLSGTSLPMIYAAADIVSDFGSTPATLWLAVYQMSAQVGRGFTHLVNVGVPT